MNGYGDQFTEDPRIEADMHKEQADTELANIIIALGIGNFHEYLNGSRSYTVSPIIRTEEAGTGKKSSVSATGFMNPDNFVRDWRVVGALETKCLEHGWRIELTPAAITIREASYPQSQVLVIKPGAGPRTRVEACAKALTALPPENTSSM